MKEDISLSIGRSDEWGNRRRRRIPKAVNAHWSHRAFLETCISRKFELAELTRCYAAQEMEIKHATSNKKNKVRLSNWLLLSFPTFLVRHVAYAWKKDDPVCKIEWTNLSTNYPSTRATQSFIFDLSHRTKRNFFPHRNWLFFGLHTYPGSLVSWSPMALTETVLI